MNHTTISSILEGMAQTWLSLSFRSAPSLRPWNLKLTHGLALSHLSLGPFSWTHSWLVLREAATTSSSSPSLKSLPVTSSTAHSPLYSGPQNPLRHSGCPYLFYQLLIRAIWFLPQNLLGVAGLGVIYVLYPQCLYYSAWNRRALPAALIWGPFREPGRLPLSLLGIPSVTSLYLRITGTPGSISQIPSPPGSVRWLKIWTCHSPRQITLS